MDFLSLTESEPSIENLDIHFNPEGWGPMSSEKQDLFGDVPYTHFDKKDRLGRHADFVMSSYSNYQQKSAHYQKRRDEYFQNNDFSFKHDAAEDSSFQLVDTAKAQSKNKFTAGRTNTQRQQQQQGNRQQQQNNQGNNRNVQGPAGRTNGGRNVPQAAGGNKNFGRPGNRRMDRKQDRNPSLAVGADWDMVEEFDLAQLLKLAANIPKVQDLAMHGHLEQYDENFDKLTTRTAKLLKRTQNKFFCDVTTGEDPVLERLAVEQVGDVYATDSILAQLMAAPRSVYSWDIVIEKVPGAIFLDKREDSTSDLLTVSETAHEPPSTSEEADPINHPDKLALEATMVNQSFSQQVLMEVEGQRKTYEANPFTEELEAASVAYKYRLFSLGSIRLVARCEVHCWTNKRDEEQLLSCHALHEWDSRLSGGVQWRQKIDNQRGAVLATELKNNSCRLARWTAQALLAGADQMKLGYVSRVSPTNPNEHAILATQFFKPKDFALQINLSMNNIWGIVKMICELLMSKEDGKYVLMKDPNKAIVRLYSIPIDSFDEDEEVQGGSDAEDGEDAEQE